MEQKQFENCIDAYADLLLRIAWSYTGSRAEAEDIVQDTFFKLCKHGHVLGSGYEKAWLIRVCVNRCKSYLRSPRAKVLPIEKAEALPSDQRELWLDLSSLKEEDRTIVTLYYLEGYTTAEIGSILKKKPNTIAKALDRAREKLKTFFEEGE